LHYKKFHSYIICIFIAERKTSLVKTKLTMSRIHYNNADCMELCERLKRKGSLSWGGIIMTSGLTYFLQRNLDAPGGKNPTFLETPTNTWGDFGNEAEGKVIGAETFSPCLPSRTFNSSAKNLAWEFCVCMLVQK